MEPDKRFAAQLTGAIVLAGATAATWWLWLGMDTKYQMDPVTGVRSGPYETWQIAGCAVTLMALAVAGALLTRPWLVVITMTGAFSIAWSVPASKDTTGMWTVGLTLLVIGMTAGTAALAYGAVGIRAAVRRRRGYRRVGR